MAAIEEKAGIQLNPTIDNRFQFLIAKKDGQITGYAAQDIVSGKWGPIYYMLAFDAAGRVRDVIVVAYEEKRGVRSPNAGS